MNDSRNDREFHDWIRRALPPAQTGPGRDLWPVMLRRLERRPAPDLWLRWALAGLALISLLVYPEAIPMLLYHL
jgi:hypothetical protein